MKQFLQTVNSINLGKATYIEQFFKFSLPIYPGYAVKPNIQVRAVYTARN